MVEEINKKIKILRNKKNKLEQDLKANKYQKSLVNESNFAKGKIYQNLGISLIATVPFFTTIALIITNATFSIIPPIIFGACSLGVCIFGAIKAFMHRKKYKNINNKIKQVLDAKNIKYNEKDKQLYPAKVLDKNLMNEQEINDEINKTIHDIENLLKAREIAEIQENASWSVPTLVKGCCQYLVDERC